MVKISDLADRLKLELAWRRTKKDLRIKGFYYHPYELELIDYNLDRWISNLRDKISSGYNPNVSEIIDVPKPYWHLRKGSILNLEDSVVYSSLILDSIDEIKKGIDWSSQEVRLSNDITNSGGTDWTRPEINGWSNFRDYSRELIEGGYDTVLFTDISSFYDTIEIPRLISDIASFGVKKDNKELLQKCLNMWAHPKIIGIPQGFKPSDILAEAYLNSIDKRLQNKGIIHLRYSDDMRIFCENRDDAIDALHHLTRLYREKGLNLQTSKSIILEKDKAITEMNGHTKIIAKIKEDMAHNIDPSMDPAEVYETYEEDEEEIDIDSLIDAFYEHVEPLISERFDKTVFHYVINRFAKAKVTIAIDYCLKLILCQPRETKYILDKYFSVMDDKTTIGEELAKLLGEKKIRLDYQKFLILKWLWENNVFSKPIFEAVYQIIEEDPIHHINLDYCLAYIGRYGEDSDYDFVYTHYNKVERDISRATILIGIKEMEEGRRNSIYGPYKSNDFFKLAIEYAKNL